MKKISITITTIICLCVSTYAYDLTPSSNGYVVKHTYYSLSYIEKHEQAEWVCYCLMKDYVNGTAERGDNFRKDLKVKTGSADLVDYKSSGYDRGHLCPAADMKQSQLAMSETFYMSNMSPQVPSFNRGAWKRLEEQVRKWALKYDSLFVVTGPVFMENKGEIGPNNVTIPGYYYKVLYSEKKNIMQAFLLPNKADLESNWRKYAVSVDSLESVTNIDFFVNMNDSLEDQLESENNYIGWIKTFGAGVSLNNHKTTKTKQTKKTNQDNQSVKEKAKETIKKAVIKKGKDIEKNIKKRLKKKILKF